MDENKLYKSLIIAVLVLAGVSLSVFIPRIEIGKFQFKGVDLFADIRHHPSGQRVDLCNHPNLTEVCNTPYGPYFNGIASVLTTSNGISRELLLAQAITSEQQLMLPFILRYPPLTHGEGVSALQKREQLKFFEDYSADGRGLDRIITSLHELKGGHGKGRIAMFGDSFIEGDIFCSEVRNLLQNTFGGNGVGFVPIASPVSQFRITVHHTFTGFRSYTVMDPDTISQPYGMGGYCFTPADQNVLTYAANPNYKHLNKLQNVRLFYRSTERTSSTYQLNQGAQASFEVVADGQLHIKEIKGLNASSIRFNFPVSDHLKLYGVSFEDSTGIYIDNLGLRGNSGLGLARISDSMMKQFNQYQNYQLIILQYGLNVVSPDNSEVGWYIKPMINVIQRLKRCYPNAAIVLFSVSDRCVRLDGKYITMQSIPGMIQAQREIARQSQVVFYNLFEAMGGANSMARMVEQDPPLANKDYTHINYRGGQKIADIFVNNLLTEFKNYNE